MFPFLKKKPTILNPVSGTLKKLEDVNDEAFSSRSMGDGFAVDPSSPFIYSPVKGTIQFIFPTKHALGIRSDSGLEILLHVGVDTVALNGEGFTLHVEENEKVKEGTRLLTVDLDLLKTKASSKDVIVVFTGGETCRLLKCGEHLEALEKDFVIVSKT
jgi:glucose-specific phosphotransferase system IIA component